MAGELRSLATLQCRLEPAVAGKRLGGRLDGAPFVLVGRHGGAETRFEPGVDAARDTAVDDLTEAPVRGCEWQQREGDQTQRRA